MQYVSLDLIRNKNKNDGHDGVNKGNFNMNYIFKKGIVSMLVFLFDNSPIVR